MSDKNCEYGMCVHDKNLHINGNCFFVTEPDKTGVEQFCKCGSQGGSNLRLARDTNPEAMEKLKSTGIQVNTPIVLESPEDLMNPRKCLTCNKDVLIRRDEDMCLDCRPYNQEPSNKIQKFMIRKPLSQGKLQKIL